MMGEGGWVTINGTHILLKDGESVSEGINRKFGGGKKQYSSNGSSGGASKGGKKSKVSKGIDSSERSRFTDKNTASKAAQDAEKALPESVHTFGNLAQTDPSVKWYTGDGYTEINDNLRGKSASDRLTKGETGKAINEHVAQIDRVIDRAPPLPKDTVLYRGVGISSGQVIASADIGSVISDSGYQSHSLDASQADFFAKEWGNGEKTIIRAKTNGRQKAIYTNANNKEYEALLARDQKWKIVGKEDVVTNGKTTHIVMVEPA